MSMIKVGCSPKDLSCWHLAAFSQHFIGKYFYVMVEGGVLICVSIALLLPSEIIEMHKDVIFE